MKLHFTKMQGAGNDFVVLDATRAPLTLDAAAYKRLADRRFGVGADQILIVGPADEAGIDFSYHIVNADGSEVEQCGNGARCFVRYVRDKGLTDKRSVRVRTLGGVIELHEADDGRVTVDMGVPVLDPPQVPFDATGLQPRRQDRMDLWPLQVAGRTVQVGVASMGNPHAVQRVDDVDAAPVAEQGPLIEHHERFPRRVNAGFMQVLGPGRIRLRVHERGAGETLACGTGACAAVVVGVMTGWLAPQVEVQMRGGTLGVAWAGPGSAVQMTGPAQTVFEGELEL
ncbi:MAG TPA: diaminopimelate epimerase [Burkholderiaceae bacterium]|nr:diaminopimelate epimerase [Burkholderiaceae bacterium]